MKEKQFYCVKCRECVNCHTEDISVIIYKNRNRDAPALKSFCPRCDTSLTKFVKVADLTSLLDKYPLFEN